MRIVLVTALAVLLFSPLAAQADLVHSGDSVTVTSGGVRRIGSGGAFIIDTAAHGSETHPDNFYTFCLEKTEYISLPGTYYASLGMAAIGGGGGAVAGQDPISTATVYLWNAYNTFGSYTVGNTTTTQFATLLNADLVAYSGSTFSAGSGADNEALQQAIWSLEGEQGVPGGGKALDLYNLALTKGTTADAGKLGVMNLWDTYNSATGEFSGPHQSMLYPILSPGSSVPEAGQIVGLSLVSLIAGLCVYSKKRFAASREDGEQNS